MQLDWRGRKLINPITSLTLWLKSLQWPHSKLSIQISYNDLPGPYTAKVLLACRVLFMPLSLSFLLSSHTVLTSCARACLVYAAPSLGCSPSDLYIADSPSRARLIWFLLTTTFPKYLPIVIFCPIIPHLCLSQYSLLFSSIACVTI